MVVLVLVQNLKILIEFFRDPKYFSQREILKVEIHVKITQVALLGTYCI
jgi:hypothetical protein